jgi:hypothetical protein
MLKLPTEVRVYMAPEPCDMRRQIDGLSALVRSAMERDPESGDRALPAVPEPLVKRQRRRPARRANDGQRRASPGRIVTAEAPRTPVVVRPRWRRARPKPRRSSAPPGAGGPSVGS